MVTITKVLSDVTVVTPTVDPTVRARTLVLTCQKLKPFTTMNVFFSGTEVNSIFVPATKVVITTSNTFNGYARSTVQASDTTERTTSVASYDILNKGDVVKCTAGSAVVIADQTIYNKSTQLNERVLYVSNVKGTLSGTITNAQNTATGTIVSVTAGTRETNSLGNLYGVLVLPSNTFKSGANKITVSDSIDPVSSASTTFAENGYVTQGNINFFDRYLTTEIYEENTVVNTTVRTVNAGPPPGWGDPLAQTFLVPEDKTEGVFVTSVDLYFAVRDVTDTNPVEVQIVEVDNGYPTARIVHWARSVVPASQISASSTSLVATRFYFQNLVKLEAGVEYAIKVLSNSTKYRVWTSFIGDAELSNSAKLITTQPYLGSFFKSQNNSTWTPEQLQDLTFKINCARFNTSVIGHVKLVENTTADYVTLPPNPFKITNGQTKVKVNHPSHGLVAGLQILYSGSTVGAFNTTFTVTSVIDSDNYIITAASQTATDLVGGVAVQAQKTIKYDSIILEGIETGKSTGVVATAVLSGESSLDTVSTPISNTYKTDLLVNKFVHTSTNRTAFLSGASSFQLNLDISSVNPYVSPQIDLNDVTVELFGSKINSPASSIVDYDIDGEVIVTGSSDVSFAASGNVITIPVTADYTKIKLGAWIKVTSGSTLNLNKTGYISNVDTTANTLTIVGDALVDEASQSATLTQYLTFVSEIANGGTAESKYITKQINLKELASNFRVIFAANIPTDADIDMYYRADTNSSVSRLSDKIWTKHDIAYKKSTVETEFTEFEYDMNDLAEFDAFQFKFVLKSTNTAATPKLKNLRIIAHG